MMGLVAGRKALLEHQTLILIGAPKTVNDIFTVVRGVWADAFGDGILKANPLDRISNVGSDVDLEHADPFSRTEIDLIGNADPDRRADARMIEFNCWAGLSLSELIGLAVEDIDLEAAWYMSAGRWSLVNSKSPKNAPGFESSSSSTQPSN
jgi:integrase